MSSRFIQRVVARGMRKTCLVSAFVVVFCAAPLAAQQPDLGTDAQRAEGKKLYDKYCSQCHGINGDGAGVATPYLKPRPRDLTSCKYKIRSTPSGALPSDQDVKSIIRRGMPYSSMPAWPNFTDQQLGNLVYHVKTFCEDFANPEYVPEAISLPKPPAKTEETIAAGREVYEQSGCVGCHGELGRGDGLSAPTLVDDWGHHIRAANLTAKWTFRGGATREDMFRIFSTGINGTPMPSYADAMTDEERWNLVDYVDSLSEGATPDYASLVVVKPVDETIELERADELFAGAPEAMFPIVGQIMQAGRNFHPMITHVKVQAIHGFDEIAVRLRWEDMIADTSGANGPTLEVPRFDPAAESGAPAGEDEGGDSVWGDEVVAEDEGDFWGDEAVAEDEEDFWGEGGDDSAGSASTSEFSDAVAIQLPMDPPVGIRKPYFLMGDLERAVDLWFTDLANGAPQRFIGRGSDSVTPSDAGDLSVSATYDEGQWSVTFKRPLKSFEGVAFVENQFVPVAFSIWDGFNEERGNKRGLTQWAYLYLEPRERQSATGPMLKAALLVLAIELLLIGWIRWRHRKVARPAGTGRAALA